MLGLRGCRLGIMYPEITAMQVRAIFEAACTVALRKGRVMPEVMIPLTAHVVEFRKQALLVRQMAEEVFRERQITVPFLLGTMIELPRAALTADEIAREAQFFSFGTNDLTQTTWGLSRDDAGHFLPYYLEHGVIEDDPFQVLDQAGVGKLIADGLRARPEDPARSQARHLRRARRGARRRGLLRPAGDELCLLLALPGADRAAGGGTGGARGARHDGPHSRHGLGAREDLRHRVAREHEIEPEPRKGLVAHLDRVHIRGPEGPPPGHDAGAAGATGLKRDQQRLSVLVDADQLRLHGSRVSP